MTNIHLACDKQYGYVTGPEPSIEQICHIRWGDAQLDGELDVLDRAVAAIVYYARLAYETQDSGVLSDALREIHRTSHFATLRLMKLMAFHPDRTTYLSFQAGDLLSTAVGQYIDYLPSEARQAILAGAEAAQNTSVGRVAMEELSDVERVYRYWVRPRLVCHLVANGYGNFE